MVIGKDGTMRLPPYALPVEAVERQLRTDRARGLSSAEAARRLAEGGPNELERRRVAPFWRLVLRAVVEPFILLLLAAGGLAIAIGEVRDGLLVIAGLVPIVAAGVITEYRGDRALEALREASAPVARVRRDGEAIDVPAPEVVNGDLVLLHTGDVVPADLRVVKSEGMLLDRSTLTGESLPERAGVAPDPREAALLERRSMAFAGSCVVGGSGAGVAVATGLETEVGRIQRSLGREARRRSPLQAELDRLVRILLVAAVLLIGFTVGIGFYRGQPAGQNLLAGISAAIAAIPEEPPVLLAVVLGLGALRLLRRGVLVRRLNAQETLGAVDLILTDKTGTLTENRLVLAGVLLPPRESESGIDRGTEDQHGTLLAEALLAEEDAWRSAAGGRPGAFTRALRESLERRYAVPSLDPKLLVRSEPPADGHAYSLTVLADGRQLALGAPEAVFQLIGNGHAARGAADWHALATAAAMSGGRLLLLARRDGSQDGWRPRALLTFEDRLRQQITEAMALASDAQIQAVVVTGDHPLTAAAVAKAAGLEQGAVITGEELDALDDDRLATLLPGLRVVARALPEQKLRLVEVARSSGRTVAVTGDGVNDAPALHRADVGVAMGSGTQVAREAADLVLGDDSFATLMYGLREGRRMVENVLKGLVFVVSTHVALLGFILVATAVGHAQPLLPLQILWLELFIDVSTSVAFEREPEEPNAMRRPPRPQNKRLLTLGILGRIGLAGGFTALAALGLMELGGDSDHARWVAYTALVVGQTVRAYANRSLRTPLTRLGMNGFLALACLAAVVVQVALPFLGPVADAFRASPLEPWEWGLVAVVAVAPALVAELVRRMGRVWVA